MSIKNWNMKGYKLFYFVTCYYLASLIVVPKNTYGQKTTLRFDKWTSAELSSAATYKGLDYLNPIDTAVLFYCNLVRINPQLFKETYLARFLENDKLEELKKSPYTKSLLSYLSKREKGKPFFPDGDLTKIASIHAEFMGKKGKTGHDNYDKRFKDVETKYTATGENCYYGSDNALEIVIQLLIDQNISSLGHRKNILSTRFNYFGGSSKPHTKYGYNYVMCFGDKGVITTKKRKRFLFF